jgi:hypothetical protein
MALIRTDISDESIASIIRVTRIGELFTGGIVRVKETIARPRSRSVDNVKVGIREIIGWYALIDLSQYTDRRGLL